MAFRCTRMATTCESFCFPVQCGARLGFIFYFFCEHSDFAEFVSPQYGRDFYFSEHADFAEFVSICVNLCQVAHLPDGHQNPGQAKGLDPRR